MTNHPSLQKARELTHEAYQRRRQAKDYLPLLLEGLKLGKKFDDQPLVAQSHVAIGERYAARGMPLKALYHLDQAGTIYDLLASDDHHRWWLCHLHSFYGIAYDDLADYQKALTHHLQSLAIARDLNDMEGHARGLLNSGWVYLQMGNGDQAISYLTQVTAYTDFPHYASVAYGHLGNAYQMREQFELAKKSYMQSANIVEDLNRKIRVLARAVSCDVALEQYEQASAILKTIEELRKLLIDISVLGETFILTAKSQLAVAHEKYQLALEYCEEGLQLAKESHNELTRLEHGYMQAETLFASGKRDHSRQKLIVLLDQNLPFYLRLSASRLLIKVYKSAGEWQLAFELLEELNQTQLISQSKIFAVQKLLDSQQQEKVLNRKNQELKALNHEKDELLQIVAHDLKNPLSATQLTLHLLLKKSEGRTLDWMLPRIERVNGSIENTFGIVSQLTTATLLETATESDSTEGFSDINFMEIVHSAVNDHVISAEHKQQQLIIHEQIPCVVYGNEMWLKQIIANLLSNAIKYSDSGSTTQIFMSKCWEDQGVCLEIKDEGLGLDEHDLQNMFQKFNRLSSTPTGGESSTGLGLYIVKMMAEKMGGTISAESAGKNQGSCFYLKFPISSASSS